MESDESVKEKVESFVPTIIKMREGEHRNHVLRLSSKSRNLIKDKLVDLTTFFIKQKLSLMRYVRPVNSKLINEVTKCISQIDCETMYFNLDLKNYKAPANILLKMVKDELKNSSILRFGYQKTSPDEDTFFVISTKHFKSFEAEKVKDKRDYRPANANVELMRKMMYNSKANRLLDFGSGKKIGGQKPGSKESANMAMIDKDEFIEMGYKPYGSFKIMTWVLLQIEVNSEDEETNPDGVTFKVRCVSDEPELYKEIEQKFTDLAKEFEKILIIRIILMKLNETREWPEDLSAEGIESDLKMNKSKQTELKKQSSSTQSKVEPVNTLKKTKKTKKSRMMQWAEKMKKVESSEPGPKLEPQSSVDKAKSSMSTEQPADESIEVNPKASFTGPVKEKELKEFKQEEEKPTVPKYEIGVVKTHTFHSNINIKTIDNLSILKNLQVNSMKNVFVIKNNYKTYVFTLTDEEQLNKARKEEKKEGLGQHHYSEGYEGRGFDDIKTEKFGGYSMGRLSSSSHKEHLKTGKSTSSVSQSEKHKEDTMKPIYLKVYGVSEPDKTFLEGIVKTIKAQIDQITLMEKAKSIHKRKPNQYDYSFIQNGSDKLILAFKLPIFIVDYMKFLKNFREKLQTYLTKFEMGTNHVSEVIEEVKGKKNATFVHKSFKTNPNRQNFYIKNNISASMAGEPSSTDLLDTFEPKESICSKEVIDEEENSNLEQSPNAASKTETKSLPSEFPMEPKTKELGIKALNEEYLPGDYTLLYNGFGASEKVANLFNKGKFAQKNLQMPTYGAALSNVILGVKLNTPEEFDESVKKMDAIAFSPLPQEEKVHKGLPSVHSELVIDKSQDVLKRIIADESKKNKLEYIKESSVGLEGEAEPVEDVNKLDDLLQGSEEVNEDMNIERRESCSSAKLSESNQKFRKSLDEEHSEVSSVNADNKISYACLHLNYKGELKDKRFLSFLLIKLTEVVVDEFEDLILY